MDVRMCRDIFNQHSPDEFVPTASPSEDFWLFSHRGTEQLITKPRVRAAWMAEPRGSSRQSMAVGPHAIHRVQKRTWCTPKNWQFPKNDLRFVKDALLQIMIVVYS